MLEGRQTLPVGGWDAPLGIALSADGLSAAMLLLTQFVALPVALYARSHFLADPHGARAFWPLTGYLLAGMNALYLSNDLFNLYVTLELVALSAVGLVAAKGGTGPVSAALRYLLVSLLASGAYLFGVALMYGAYGTVSLDHLAPLVRAHGTPAVAFAAALMLFGLLLKTALFPFHFWLPGAHGGAPAPVSALLSALVIKASFYLIVRLWFGVFAPIVPIAAANLLGALGSAAIVWGSLMALRQTRLKMLVAYSTVAQIGYLFLLFPLASSGAPATIDSAIDGVLLLALAHGMAKAAMFASAGAMVLNIGRDDIARLRGISARLPLSLFTFALAGITLIGLPPSAGFLAKWLMIDAAIRAGLWGWIVVLIAGGLLSAAYVFKVLRQAFVPALPEQSAQRAPQVLEWPAFVLALASLAPGLRATELLALIGAR
jgi:formate hydrogenlyase subunit 3/multisubunit Na+/H+ antiporter MnhD subunit